MPISYMLSSSWYIPHKQKSGQLVLLVTYLLPIPGVFCAQSDFGNVVSSVAAIICDQERTD